jgi:hypothetical protein
MEGLGVRNLATPRAALAALALALCAMVALAPAAEAAKKKKKKKVTPVAAIAASNTVAPDAAGTATATCPPNKTLVGGGFASGPLEGPNGPDFGTFVTESRRDGASSWRVSATNLDVDTPGTVSAYAYCRKGAAPLTEALATISNECACLPVVTAVATCPNDGRAVAGGFSAPFDVVDGGAWAQASHRFGAFAWRFDAIDVSANGAVVTSYAYCAPRARTETSGVRVITSNPDSGSGNGTAYAQLCRRRGQRMLAGGFKTETASLFASELQLVSQSAAVDGRFATSAVQTGFGGDGTLQSYGYCG